MRCAVGIDLLLPRLVDRHAVEPRHLRRAHVGVRIEAGGIDQHAKLDVGPVRHDDAVRHDTGDLSLNDMGIGELHRLVIVFVRLGNARTAEIIIGCELLLQLGVLDVVEIGPVLVLHGLALRPGVEAPSVALVDHLPQPVLLALVAARQS